MQGKKWNQSKYANEVLASFGMYNCNYVKNLVVPGCRLSKNSDGGVVDVTLFKWLVGSLRYLTSTRPDLMFSMNLVSRYMEHPIEEHLLTAKRILTYVKYTIDFRVAYRKGRDEDLVGYADSDYIGDLDDKKIT